MGDYFFKKFYDDVKDPTWPIVTNYNEFLCLPKHIQDECNTIHKLSVRISELEDIAYWKNNSTHNLGYSYNNVVYVPVFKCASTYYTQVFHKHNRWQKVKLTDVDWDTTKAVGLIMNPMTRRVKGIVEALVLSYSDNYSEILQLLEQENFCKLLSTITMLDAHSMPYTYMFGDLLNKVHWIPMELFTDTELKNQIVYFLDNNNVKIIMTDSDRTNKSSKHKTQIFNKVQEIFLTTAPPAELGMFFANDVKFYNNLLKTYAILHNHN
jgi:hypothetical protein